MEIVNVFALLFFGAIVIISVLHFWTRIWKKLCSPVWKTIYTLIGTGILVFAFYSEYYVIHKNVVTGHIETSAKAPPTISANAPTAVISSVECYKAAYELFDSQLSNLLTFLGVFGTIFGLIVPFILYFFQKQSLKEERDVLKTYVDRIVSAEKRLKEISELQKDHFLSETTSFHAVVALAFSMLDPKGDPNKSAHLLQIILIAFDNTVNCATKAKDSITLYEVMSGTVGELGKFLLPGPNIILEAAIMEMKKDKGKIIKFDPHHFVSGEEILEVLGYHNEDLFVIYKKIYEKIYPWKFNGQQKKA